MRKIFDTPSEKNRFLIAAVLAPLALALLVALFGPTPSAGFPRSPISFFPMQTTADGTVSNKGLSVTTAAVSSDAMEEEAVILPDNVLLLTVGGSGSCPPHFDKIELVNREIKLRSVERGQTHCTEDWRLYSFVIRSESPLDVHSVTVSNSFGQPRTIAVTNASVNEGTTLDGGILKWSDSTVSEVHPSEEVDHPAYKKLLNTPGLIGVKSADEKTVFFKFGSNPTCQVNFVSLNRYGDQIQLFVKAGGVNDACATGFETKRFKITSETVITEREIVVTLVEYPNITRTIEILSSKEK